MAGSPYTFVTQTDIGVGGQGLVNTTAPFPVVTVTPATLTVGAAGLTTNDKIYDGTTTATLVPGTPTLVGVIGTDVVTLVTTGASGTFADKNVGTAKTVTIAGLTLTGANASNYILTQPTRTANITTRPITVTAATDTKTYDGTTSSTGIPTLSAGTPLAPGDTAPAWTQSFDNKNAGSGKTLTPAGAVVDGNNGLNYAYTFAPNTSGTITPKAITVTATTDSKVYDGTTSSIGIPTLSAGTPLAPGDTAPTWTQAFDTKNAGTTKSLVPTGRVIDGNGGLNYAYSYIPVTTGVITAAPLVVSAAGVNKVYDGTTTATVTLSDNRVAGDVLTTGYGSAAFADKNVGTGRAVSVSGITLTGADAVNYTLNTTASTTASITAAALAVSAAGVNKVYDGTTTATVTLSDNRMAGDVLTTGYGSAAFADKNVGTAKTVSVSGITLTGTDAGNYTHNTTASTTANITAVALAVSATGVNKVYDGATTATVTLSDNRVAGDVLTTGYGSAAFADKNVGTAKTVSVSGITLTGTDAGNYTHDTTTSTTADITAATLAVSAAGVNKVYDGATTATVTLSDNRVAGDVLTTGYGSAAFADKNVGMAKTVSVSGITLTGADAANYTHNTTASTTANITAATLAVSAAGVNKVYDGATTAMVTLSDNRVAGDVLTTGYGSAAFADKIAGMAKPVSVSGITLTGADAANYAQNTTASTTANITAATLAVSAAGVNKVYDGTTAATVTLSDDRVAGDVLTTGYGSAAFADKNAATAKPVSVSGITLTGTDAGNYTHNTTTSTTADITAATLAVSAAEVNKVYNGATTATVTLSDNRVAGDVLTTGYGSAAFADKNVGTGKAVSVSGITLTGADAANYTHNTTASTTANITAATLAVSAAGVNKVYDGTTAATVTLSDNRVAGDMLTTGYGSAAFADKNVGTGKAVSVSGITLTGADAANYTHNPMASTTANITAATLAVSATGVNKVYDGTTAATVTLSDNRVAGDVLTTGYGSAAFADKNVGTAKTVSVSGITLTGADAANYTHNPTASTTANITAATLAVSAAGVNKVYDGTTAATVTLSDNRVAGDVLTTGYGSAAFGDKNVGTGKAVNVSGITLTGTDAVNYTHNTTASTTADISPAPLVVTALDASRAYGQPNPVFKASYTGFVNGETNTVLGGTLVLSTTADSSSPVGTYPITASGLTAINYSITYSNGTLTIAPLAPTVLSITLVNTADVAITWSAVSNRSYRVQYNPVLGSTNWTDLTGDVTATGNTASKTDPRTTTNRFYRVQVLP